METKDTTGQAVELMKPRYKVIVDYPQSNFKVGDIWPNVAPDWTTDEQKDFTLAEMSKYPHLFKPLQWWQDRKIEEMPEYVKRITNPLFKSQPKFGEVLHVAHWKDNGEDGNYAQFIEYHGQYWKASNFEPATEKDYNTYKNNL